MNFFKKYILTPPIFFPLAAAFFWVFTVHYLWSAPDELDAVYGLWMVLGSALATLLLSMKRWVAVAYLTWVVAGLVMNFGMVKGGPWQSAGGSLSPVDWFLALLVIFFFRSMTGWPQFRK